MTYSKDLLEKIINFYKLGYFDLAKNKLLPILNKNKGDDYLLNVMGMILQSEGKYNESINYFQRAILNNKNNIPARNNLGNSLKYTKQFQEAETQFRKVINSVPNYISAIVNLANLKVDTNKILEAIELFEKAKKINDKISIIHLNLAHAYQSVGDYDKSESVLKECLKLDYFNTKADKMLSTQINYKYNKNHLDEMIKKKNNKNLNEISKIYLNFAIAKAFEDLKNYEKSWNFIFDGNNSKNKLIKQNTNIEMLKNDIETYFFNFNRTNKKISEKKIIFIIGMPRSGTTLLQNIISSHKDAYGLGEINFIGYKITSQLKEKNRINKEEFDNLIKSDLASEYLNFCENFDHKNKILVDKSLDNFLYIGFINYFFPNAKIIHCKRNPKDNCLSIFKNLFDAELPWAYDQKKLYKYYNFYSDIMNFWNKNKKLNIFNINYENLVSEPETNIRKLINYCGLEWDDNCLNFHKQKLTIKTLSLSQANKPIYKTSVNLSNFYEDKLDILFNNLK